MGSAPYPDEGGGSAGRWTRQPIASNQADVDIAGLDGDADGVYEVYVYATNAHAGAVNYYVRPNAASTNQQMYGLLALGSGDAGAISFTLAALYLGAVTSTGKATMHFTFFAKTGAYRSYTGSYYSESSVAAPENHGTHSGRWSNTADNITSLRIHADQADGLGAGSYILWRKLPEAA